MLLLLHFNGPATDFVFSMFVKRKKSGDSRGLSGATAGVFLGLLVHCWRRFNLSIPDRAGVPGSLSQNTSIVPKAPEMTPEKSPVCTQGKRGKLGAV